MKLNALMLLRKLFPLITILLFTNISQAQVYSTDDGDWGTEVLHGYTIGNGEEVNIQHIIDANSQIRVEWGGKLNILSGSLTIHAGLVTLFGGDVTVSEDAVLIVEGNLNNVIAGDLIIDGTLLVTGDVNNLVANVEVGSTGTLGIGGDFNNTGGTTNNGEINVGGNITGNAVDGDVEVSLGQNVALPIELVYFNAVNYTNTIQLNWQTASEKNNDYFTIERSQDGVNYEVIGTLPGAGNSHQALDYSYTDNNPVNGISYYRLTQTDYNGEFEVFSPVSVSYLSNNVFEVYPNPASEDLNINLGNYANSGILKIYNKVGKLVLSKFLDNTYSTVNISRFPAGDYIVVFSDEFGSTSKQVIFQ